MQAECDRTSFRRHEAGSEEAKSGETEGEEEKKRPTRLKLEFTTPAADKYENSRCAFSVSHAEGFGHCPRIWKIDSSTPLRH